MSQTIEAMIKKVFESPLLFAENMSGLKLRSYQEEVAMAVIDSVMRGSGLSFVVMFPRQSGKTSCKPK